MRVPIVTIVGRPNVGKSTLFNRIIGTRVAITSAEAGTTRDRLFHKVKHPVLDFYLVDTGGLEFGTKEGTIEENIQLQSKVAMEEGDLILFVTDGQRGMEHPDKAAAELIRKTVKKPVLLVVNKCDEPADEVRLAEYYSLGLGQPFQISALHKNGMDLLMEQITLSLKERHFLTKKDPRYAAEVSAESKSCRIAMAGRPNVGKSSLINALLNKKKLIVSDVPGTTRDSTDSFLRHGGKDYVFIDTAGLKRPGKTVPGIEKFSALRSMASIEQCDVALLVLDSSVPITHQDQVIASYIVEAGKGLVILANKWDLSRVEKAQGDERPLTEEEKRSLFISRLRRRFPFLSWAPVVFTSAITKKNLPVIFDQIGGALEERRKRIPTARLNAFMEKMLHGHAPTGQGRANPKVYYMTQAEIDPPLFLIFVNRKDAFHFSYARYVENSLRKEFGFFGTPVKIEFREKPREPRH